MDDITEVYVVEEYDLEEGEITDDGDMEVDPEPEQKKLPKRYCLHQKKISNEKRKRDCKHSRYKVKSKDKSSPILNGVHKKHKSSCPLQHQVSSTGKHDAVMHIPPLIDLTKPYDNNSVSLQSTFKNFTSPPRSVQMFPNSNRSVGQEFDGVDNYPDLLLAYKKSRGHLDHRSKSNDYDNPLRHCSPKTSNKHSPKESISKSKSQTKHLSNEKSSPPKNKSKHTSSEKVSPKKIETKQPLREKSSPIKSNTKQPLLKKASPINETKQPSHGKASPIIHENNPDLNKKTFITKSESQPFNESNSVPMLRLSENVSAMRKAEKRTKEESDDEEELRKIALATCAIRSLQRQRQKASENSNLNNSPSHSPSDQSSVTMLVNGDNGSSGNYEVVDMDLDDENFTEDVDVEDKLFVIDNNPIMSSEFKQDIFYGQSYICDNSPAEGYLPPTKDIYLSTNQAHSNDFEEDALLRAELLASIASKKKVDITSEPTTNLAAKLAEIVQNVGNASPQGQIPKVPVAYSNGQKFNPVTANVKRTGVVKLNNSKLPHSKKIILPKPRNINATQERLIITLNNDSSSDESDETEEENNENGLGNAITGIDALISNARHKSDIKASANLNQVSSLSKAQQEEYKKLRSILAEKETMTIIPQAVKEKNTGHQNLNFLTNKISVAKEKLNKEMEVLTNTEKDVLNRKKVYIASKLKFQHLQEQLHAAKLTKAANLKTWKLCEAKLVNAKNVVAKQKALVSWLEAELNNRLQIDQNSSSPIL